MPRQWPRSESRSDGPANKSYWQMVREVVTSDDVKNLLAGPLAITNKDLDPDLVYLHRHKPWKFQLHDGMRLKKQIWMNWSRLA